MSSAPSERLGLLAAVTVSPVQSRPGAVLVLSAAVAAALAGCGGGSDHAASAAQPVQAAVAVDGVAAGAPPATSGTPTGAAKPAAAKSSATTTAKTAAKTAAKVAAKVANKSAANTTANTTARTTAARATIASTTAASSSSASYGNPSGHVHVPAAARAVSTSHPTRYIGNGTAKSCTSAAVVRAVARGGIIRFNCGTKHVTIHMTRTAKIYNKHHLTVLDGRGKVTLDGGGKIPILEQNTCDQKLGWETARCDLQTFPMLAVQNLTFANGNSIGHKRSFGGGGGIYVFGGQVKLNNVGFFDNRCDTNGGGLRVIIQKKPVYVVNSTFDGGKCANGGGIGGLAASVEVYNSVFRNNTGTSTGGAIALDGAYMKAVIAGTKITGSRARGRCGRLHEQRPHREPLVHRLLPVQPQERLRHPAGTRGLLHRGAGRSAPHPLHLQGQLTGQLTADC